MNIIPSMLPNVSTSTASRVVRCENVRVKGGCLSYVGLPNEINLCDDEALPGGRLIGVVTHRRLGRIAMFDRVGGTHLGYAFIDRPSPAIIPLVASTRSYVDAQLIASDTIALLSSEGILALEVDGETLVAPPSTADFPPLQFRVTDVEKVSADIPSRRLTGIYDATSTRLSAADAAAMHSDTLDAVGSIVAHATESGRFVQGHLMRYRLRDFKGRTLYCSSPVLVAPPTGLNFMSQSSARVDDDFKAYGERQVSAFCFNVGLHAPDAIGVDWSRLVADAVVEVSMPLHAFDCTASCGCDMRRRADGSTWVYGSLSGSVSTVGDVDNRARSVIASALASDSAFVTLSIVPCPFDRGDVLFQLLPPSIMFRDVATQVKALASACNNISRHSLLEALCRCQHRYGATSAARCGSTIAWGDITVNRAEAPQLVSLACEFASEAWEGWTMVEFADRRRVVTLSSGSSSAPVSLFPLISYPSPDAVRFSVGVRRGSRCYYASFSLTPSADGLSAVYIAPNGGSVEIPVAQSYSAPPAQACSDSFDGAVALSADTDPFVLSAAARPESSGRVVALTGAIRRGSAWQSAQRRIWVFATDAVRLLSISNSSTAMTFQLVDSRGVDSRGAVAVTSTTHAPVVAVAGGDLIALRNASSTTVIPGVGLCDVAWDAVDSELWLVNRREGFPRVIPDVGPEHYQLTSLAAGRMFTTGCGMIVEDDERRLLDTSLGRVAGYGEIEWEVEVMAPPRRRSNLPQHVRSLRLNLFSEKHNPRVSVLAAYRPVPLLAIPDIPLTSFPPREVIVEYGVSGRMHLPTLLPTLVAPSRPYIALRLKGDADASLALHSISLTFG